MRKFDLRFLWGGLLIFAGVMFLLQQMDLIPSAWDFIWSIVFIAAGVAFLFAFWTDRTQWWPLIPGFGLLSLGVLIGVNELLPEADWVGAIFLGGIGISFWLIYALNRENWWAVIPGGVLVTLAFVVGVESFISGDAGGGITLIGLGLTFFLVGIMPTPQGRMKWAFIPGSVLLIIGVFLITPLMPLFNYVWPIALIIVGGYFIIRNFRS